MNETEFLDLLRYYFRNAKTEEVEEILADYESHLKKGKERPVRGRNCQRAWQSEGYLQFLPVRRSSG